MASLTAARVAFSKMCDDLDYWGLGDQVDVQITAHCAVVQPRSEADDFLGICAVLSDVFDGDRTAIHPVTGVMKGFIDRYLVLVLPYGERRILRSVALTSGDCS